MIWGEKETNRNPEICWDLWSDQLRQEACLAEEEVTWLSSLRCWWARRSMIWGQRSEKMGWEKLANSETTIRLFLPHRVLPLCSCFLRLSEISSNQVILLVFYLIVFCFSACGMLTLRWSSMSRVTPPSSSINGRHNSSLSSTTMSLSPPHGKDDENVEEAGWWCCCSSTERHWGKERNPCMLLSLISFVFVNPPVFFSPLFLPAIFLCLRFSQPVYLSLSFCFLLLFVSFFSVTPVSILLCDPLSWTMKSS